MAVRQEHEPVTLETAAADLEEALKRLERGVAAASERMGGIAGLENEAKRLANDRAQLAHALDRMTTRASRLDGTADEVAKRLVAAMEKVRLALSKQEG